MMKRNFLRMPAYAMLAGLIFIQFSFNGKYPHNQSLIIDNQSAAKKTIPIATKNAQVSSVTNTDSVYNELFDSLNIQGLSHRAFMTAVKGFEKIKNMKKLADTSLITIIDFSKPSYQKRLFIIDMVHVKLLHVNLVAHGKNSGKEWATTFSNISESYKSSPGFYVTGNTYMGGNGYSLKLFGIERGINDNAYKRAIVMHGAPYVCPGFISSQGYIGRSQGCPAVPVNDARKIINTIDNGTCLFIYTPHEKYLNKSPFLNRV